MILFLAQQQFLSNLIIDVITKKHWTISKVQKKLSEKSCVNNNNPEIDNKILTF